MAKVAAMGTKVYFWRRVHCCGGGRHLGAFSIAISSRFCLLYPPVTAYIIYVEISVCSLHLVYYFPFQRSQERKCARKQCQDDAEVREVIRSLGKGTLRDHKQETMKEAINELEMSVSKLSRENKEMKKLVSCLCEQNNEMKQAVLELCSNSRRQEKVILKLAQKHGIESDPVTQD